MLVTDLPKSDTDIVIVGAGPTGLIAAVLLQQSGISFRIVDKQEQQAHETRAFVLHARSLELLQKIGLIEEFLKRGVIAPGLQVFTQQGMVAQVDLDDIGNMNTPYAFLFMCPQSEIEKILSEYLTRNGVNIERGTEVIDLSQTNEKATVTVKNKSNKEEKVECQYIIGADGAHSIVRSKLDLDFEGASYVQTFMLADCSIDWPLDYSHIKIFMRDQSLALYFPLKGKTLGRMFAIKPFSTENDTEAEKQATTATPVTLEDVQKAYNDASYIPATFSDPVWTSRYRIHHRAVKHYRVGRAFVAGDAAHIHSPVGAQGMNTGIQDAANVSWKIIIALKNKGNTALLESYDSERRRIGEKLLKYTDRLFSIVSSQNKWIDKVRNIVFPHIIRLVSKSHKARSIIFHFVSQLGIHYHDNAFLENNLSETAKKYFPKKLRAGYRAPNATISQHIDVFDLTKGYIFHVIALSKKSLSKDEIQSISNDLRSLPSEIGLPVKNHFIAHSLTGPDDRIIQAESNQIFENYGLSEHVSAGLFLIRPDGYIAYCSDNLSTIPLKKFMTQFTQ